MPKPISSSIELQTVSFKESSLGEQVLRVAKGVAFVALCALSIGFAAGTVGGAASHGALLPIAFTAGFMLGVALAIPIADRIIGGMGVKPALYDFKDSAIDVIRDLRDDLRL